ncbi:MAG TPA: CPBP family intramembrane glutamic endopeptidase [Phycisphaerales bacterium]|nr:CPBP family intramembrane glutamic endopeptidase [Phycisphaerales bacterium]
MPSKQRKDRAKTGAAKPKPTRAPEALPLDNYWTRSMRPLHVLVFLLPLIGAYELGSLLYLSDHLSGKSLSVTAYKLFLDLFHLFGLAGASLPSIALLFVFLTWHLIKQDSWKIDPNTLAGMFLESLAWTLPLLVMAAMFSHARAMAAGVGVGEAREVLANTTLPLNQLPAMTQFTIAVGAGLYEEMLFRLVGLALLHFILVDLIGIKPFWGHPAAILVAALAFAAYHQNQTSMEFLFKMIAGIYFGTVYMMRGFGIVVATHALYDILVLVVLQRH